MTLFKNTLLFIIAIQVLVVIQLLSIKTWNLTQTYNQLIDRTLSFNFTFPTTSPKMSPEEYKFFTTLSTSPEMELEKHDSNLIQNKLFTLGQGYIRKAIKDDVESKAKDLLGKPYVWGATGPNKFDCSGFTQKVFRQAGIRIPRNSRAQAKVGEYVAYEHLKRGDMVFFATDRKTPKRVTHVGIYLSDGKFIHASSGGKRVIISSMAKSKYYKNKFLLGRRIISGHKTKHVAQVFSYNDKQEKTSVNL